VSQTLEQGSRSQAGLQRVNDTAAEAAAPNGVSPDHLLNVAFSFAASKAVLSAVELGVFTHLAEHGPETVGELTKTLSLHPRSARDFFDTLVALQFLDRDGLGRYRNTAAADLYLDRAKPTYLGGMMEMANARLYKFWGNLTEGLRTGTPQNELRDEPDLFDRLYADPQLLKNFLAAMTGLSRTAGRAIAEKLDWSKYQTVIDVGCAQGAVPIELALRHPHLRGGGFDLPAVRPVFEEFVKGNSLADRLTFYPGDMFNEPLPHADVIVMGHILHDWNLEQKLLLVRRAYEALPPGGAYVVHDAIIDDERRTNVGGLLMSLNMLIETRGGFDYTGADCGQWLRDAGFREVRQEHLGGPDSMVVGIK
jgi:SAM-dependent methyltransferase